MKRSPTAQKPQRNSGLTWRIFEALVALFCLLATHQAIWVYFNKDLSQKLRTEYPNPSVWLFPLAVSEADTASAKQTEFEVDHSPIDLAGYGPSEQEVVLKVNAVDKKKKSSSDGRLEFKGIPLRRGVNKLQAFPLENETYSTRLEAQEPAQSIYFNPPQPLAPRLLRMIAFTRDSVALIGAADPATKVFWRNVAKAESYEVRVDALGFFKYVAHNKSAEAFRVTLWARPQRSRAQAAILTGDSVVIAPRFAADSLHGPFNRRVTITLRAQNKFTLAAEATISPQMQLYSWVEHELITAEEILRLFFGIELSTFAIKPTAQAPFQQNLPEILEDNRLRLTLAGDIPEPGLIASFTKSGALNDVPLALPEDEIRLIVPGVALTKINQPASRVLNQADSAQTFLWRHKPNKRRDDDNILFKALYDSTQSPAALLARRAPADSGKGPSAATAPKRPQASPNHFFRQLQKLESVMPYKLRDFLHALLNAMPFVWLLWILSQQGQKPRHGYRAILYAATLTFLIYHVTLLCLPLFSTSFRFLDPFLANLVEIIPSQIMRETVKNLGIVYPFMTIGMVLLFRLIYSALLQHQTPRLVRSRRAKHVFRWLFFWPAALLLPLTLLLGLVLVRKDAAAPMGAQALVQNYLVIALIFVGLGLVFCWFFLYWLLTFGLGMKIQKRIVIRVSWAMLALPLLPLVVEAIAAFLRYSIVTEWKIYPFFLPTQVDSFLWFIIIVWAGTALFKQFMELTIRLTRNAYGFALLHSPAAQWVLFLVFVLCSLPMNYVGGTVEGRTVSIYDLNALAIGIANLLPYALLLGLVIYLRNLSRKDQFELGAEAIRAGTLLFAYYLIGRATSLVFAPIPILLGWFIFTRFVLVERVSLPAIVAGEEARSLVRRLLDFKTARESLYSLQKSLRKKYAQGDIDLDKLNANIAASQARVKETENALPKDTSEVKRKIFGYGPEPNPAANAKIAVLYGMVFSIPFQAGKWLNIFENPEVVNYPLLSLLTKLLFSLSTWFLIAFVFGYFFHKIRGHDGFFKALVFTGGYLVATIPLRLINLDPILEQGFVVQAVQVLAYVLLLALLAFDLRRLQGLDYGWRELLEVHGFTKITAYGSSIVLATIASLSGRDLIPFVWNIFNWVLGAKTP